MADGLFYQLDRQRDFGPELFMPHPKLGILAQYRVHLLMEAIPCLFLPWDREIRKMRGYRRFPLGQFLIAAIDARLGESAPGH